jgi:hypothetical protein
MAPARLPLYRISRRSSSPPPLRPHHHDVLPHDPHHRGVLVARGHTTRLMLSPPLRAPCAPYHRGQCRAHRAPHSSPPAAILFLHRDRIAGSRYAMLRPPGCHVFVESVCCKRMFRVFQMFQRYVASISDGCCKNRSGCCIYCNSCTRMLQRSVTNVSSVFSGRMVQVCLSGCCICFTHRLHVFYLDVAYVCNGFRVFQKHDLSVPSASDVYCNCCIWMF